MGGVEDADGYATHLLRTCGAGRTQASGCCSPESTYATTSVATYEQERPVGRQAPSRPLTAAQRLSLNREIKRAASGNVTILNHLSTLYHMNRRIYEMYSKGGKTEHAAAGTASSSRPATASRGPCSRQQQWATAEAQPRGGAAGAFHGEAGPAAGMQAAALRPATAAPPAATSDPAPSYVKRHVANTRAALKEAILDEIVEHRVYEGARLRALFRSYLKLNSGEAFFSTLADVIDELRQELGVA